MRTEIYELRPHAGLFDLADETTLYYGVFGETVAFRATRGFSLWIRISTFCSEC